MIVSVCLRERINECLSICVVFYVLVRIRARIRTLLSSVNFYRPYIYARVHMFINTKIQFNRVEEAPLNRFPVSEYEIHFHIERTHCIFHSQSYSHFAKKENDAPFGKSIPH